MTVLDWFGLGLLAIVGVYMLIRVGTAAYFRSKSDFMKRTPK
jgi:hypothetical protein